MEILDLSPQGGQGGDPAGADASRVPGPASRGGRRCAGSLAVKWPPATLWPAGRTWSSWGSPASLAIALGLETAAKGYSIFLLTVADLVDQLVKDLQDHLLTEQLRAPAQSSDPPPPFSSNW